MTKTVIVTDSNSGITQAEAEKLGISVLPMPFLINGEEFFEDVNLTQEAFYEKLRDDNAQISTSQPSIASVTELWDKLLETYDEVVHIPMSSGLSESCRTAEGLAKDYGGRVHVVQSAHFHHPKTERLRRTETRKRGKKRRANQRAITGDEARQ